MGNILVACTQLSASMSVAWFKCCEMWNVDVVAVDGWAGAVMQKVNEN